MQSMQDLVVSDVEAKLRHRLTFRINLLITNHTHLRAHNPQVNHQRLQHFHDQTCENDLVPRTTQVPVPTIGFSTTVNPRSYHEALTPSTVRKSGKTVKHFD
jgi:hypothetical protein